LVGFPAVGGGGEGGVRLGLTTHSKIEIPLEMLQGLGQTVWKNDLRKMEIYEYFRNWFKFKLRILHNEEFHNVYSTPSIIRTIK
jgi:hypothetical protein